MADYDTQPVSIQISCNLPFPLYIDGSYEVRLGDTSVNVVIDHVRQETFDQRLGIDSGEFDLKIDRIGVAGYATLQIVADWASFETLLVTTRSANPRDIALLVANKVIESYRHATRTPWIRRLKPEELFQVNYLEEDSEGHPVGQIDKVLPGCGVTLPRRIQRGNKDFIRRLASNVPVEVWNSLWLDSEDALASGDVRSAIISGHSAIETLANATVLAWARDQGLSVDQAACRWGRNNSEKGSLRANLSIDELVSFLNDTRKVEIALLDVCEADQSWGFDICSRFERLAADRNRTLHAGVNVKESYALDHVTAIRAIRQHFLMEENVKRIQSLSRPASAAKTLTERLGREVNPELSRLLHHLEATGTVITVWSMRRYPISLHKNESTVALVWDENRLDVYLRSKQAKVDDDAEKELTRMLIKHSLFQEGWPCAAVKERDDSGQLALFLNWEGYKIIARAVTEAVLGLIEINGVLKELGFNVQEELEARNSCLKKQVASAEFIVPKLGDVNYNLILVQVSLLNLSGIDRDWCLPSDLEMKAEAITQELQRLIERCRDLHWEHSRVAATLLLALLSQLGMLNTIGVSDGPRREIRTRLTNEELKILKDSERDHHKT